MKIRIFLFQLILVLIPETIFCQEKMKQIDVGGKLIWLPTPEKDMSEIGDSLTKLAEIQVPPGNILKAVFLPKDVISKLGLEPISDRKKVLVETNESLEKTDLSENDFKDAVSYLKESFPSDLLEITQKTNIEFEKIKDRLGKQEVDKMEILGTIMDSKDAFAYLMSFKYKEENTERMIYAGLLTMRVKNRMIYGYFYNYSDYEESINWIANIIPVWSKKVLEYNQEISSPKKKSEINSYKEINNLKNTQEHKKSDNPVINILRPIYELFRDLLIKVPVTFICLVLLIIAYYISSRKLYYKHKASYPKQPSAYDNYIKSKNPNKNGALWATLFILEFVMVAFIFLYFLRLIGFSIPSGLL